MKKIYVRKENPFSKIANELILQLTNEISERYEHKLDGKGGFSAEEVNIEKAGFYVLFVNEMVAGCGALRPLYKNEIAEIKRMYIKPEFRKKGLAKILLDKLEMEARNFGFSKIWLETGDRQPEAIGLYEKKNYSRIENYGIYKENIHSNCFEKVLK